MELNIDVSFQFYFLFRIPLCHIFHIHPRAMKQDGLVQRIRDTDVPQHDSRSRLFKTNSSQQGIVISANVNSGFLFFFFSSWRYLFWAACSHNQVLLIHLHTFLIPVHKYATGCSHVGSLEEDGSTWNKLLGVIYVFPHCSPWMVPGLTGAVRRQLSCSLYAASIGMAQHGTMLSAVGEPSSATTCTCECGILACLQLCTMDQWQISS